MATADSAAGLEALPKPQNYSAIRIWQRLMAYLSNYKLWVSLAAVGIIGMNLLMIVVPYILRDVVDIGIARQDSAYMLSAGLLVVFLGLIRGAVAFSRSVFRRAPVALRVV